MDDEHVDSLHPRGSPAANKRRATRNAANCGSISARHPVSARPTRCLARPTGASVAVPTLWPRSSRLTAGEDSPTARGHRTNPTAHHRIPRRSIFELDVPAVLARRPEVVLVDELAHTNTPGSKNAKRWMDIEELLDAGITVLSTVNVQHLESLNDVVTQITGIEQQETVPDEMVRAAAQIELVDVTPEALRRRLSHGNVYAADRVDAALSNYFRRGNLTALRGIGVALARRSGRRRP